MQKIVRSATFWVVVALVSTAGPVAAQELAGTELGVGYQYLHIADPSDSEDASFPLGFNVDVAFPVSGPLSVVGEVGWSRDSDDDFGFETTLTATSFGGGVRWSGRTNPSVTPYAQVILGAQRDSFDIEGFSDSETNFILQPEGGVTVPVGAWGAFAQVGYRRVFYEDEGANGFRLVIGARFNLR